jgi:glycosyltransferase involved in cell wall biosynthesis
VRVVHAYKIYRPDVEGGIPQVISVLTAPHADVDPINNQILVARDRGLGRCLVIDGTPVTSLTSFGTLFSTPLSPTFPIILRRVARDADVLVHHAPFPLTDIGIAAGLSARTALIVYWHAEILGRVLLRKLLTPAIRATLQRADRIVVSDTAMIENSDFLKPHREKCVVVRYGLNIDYWNKLDASDITAVAALRQRYPRLIVAVGRLVGYKGLDVLLDALPHVDAQLVIIGEGPLLDELKRQAARNGVAGRVIFIGRVTTDEIKQYLHAAKMLVLSSVSDAEAFGLVQVEAMAACVPVINTNLPTTVPAVARHDQEGLTVAVGDAGALASAMDLLLQDTALASRLGNAGLNRARTEFSQETYRTRMAQVIRDAREHRKRVSGQS